MKIQELFELAPGGNTTSQQQGPSVAAPPPALAASPAKRAEAIRQAGEDLNTKREELKAAQNKVSDARRALDDAQKTLSNVRTLTNPVEENTQLNEYSVDFGDNLVTLLRNLVGQADDKGKSSKISYIALERMLQKTVGSSVSLDKEIFTELNNSNKKLSKYVEKIGNHGVVLATEIKYKPKAKPTKKTPKTKKSKKSGVERAASSGAKYLAKSRNNP